MAIKELSVQYQNIISDYATSNNVTEETALSNMMGFMVAKDAVTDSVRIAIENPTKYVMDPESLDAKAIRRMYMDLFGEDTVGARIKCFYDPKKTDVLLLFIHYDREIPVWDIIDMFHRQIPSIDIVDEEMLLLYVSDVMNGTRDEIKSLMDWCLSDGLDDEAMTDGYFESIYDLEADEDDEEEEFE